MQNTGSSLEQRIMRVSMQESTVWVLEDVAETLNPKAKVNCLICPPDKHPENVWCRWEFTV